MRRHSFFVIAIALLAGAAFAAPRNNVNVIGVNVLVNQPLTTAILTDLGAHGNVREVLYEIRAVQMHAPENELAAIRAEAYVVSAGPDAERRGSPVDTVGADDFVNGLNTWDLDSINVTNFGKGRTIAQDGSGVWVAVLDTGLLDTWRQYFPEQRIATQYGKCFQGGGNDQGTVSEPANCWEHDTNSHGTHVTSSIIGYNFRGTFINGTAPKVTIIPSKFSRTLASDGRR